MTSAIRLDGGVGIDRLGSPRYSTASFSLRRGPSRPFVPGSASLEWSGIDRVPAIGMTSPRKAMAPWGKLPPRMKVLYITTLHRSGRWLVEAFVADSASEIELEEAIGVTSGMARLREEVFDAVLISHEPGVLDALELVEGLRAGGSDEPLIVLGKQGDPSLTALSFEVGADAYCAESATTTRSLIWIFARAIERQQLIRENRRLVQADRQRLQYEHHEAERLLAQQRGLVEDLESLRDGEASTNKAVTLSFLPERLVEHYREMLRAYVIMGSGNLTGEMTRLAELLATAGVTARQTIQLHVQVLEELIRGLGNRSARHVMNRADLLVLEVMVHLSEGYRERYLHRVHPPLQLILPGFDRPAA